MDAAFDAGWQEADSNNLENVLSRTGYVIYYANCPLLWSSKLQTEIVLSTVESEYIALSQAMRDVIPLIHLLTEINCVYSIHNPEPIIKCKVHKDNESCIAMCKAQRFSQRTRHIAINITTSYIIVINQ